MLCSVSRIGVFVIVLVSAACGRAEESAAPQPEQLSPPSAETSPTSSSTGAGVITGFVFDDRNRDGQFDPGEARLPMLTILLTNPAATERFQSATTGAAGGFRFETLAAGEYRISLQIPEGYERTNDDSFLITLSTDQPASEVRFGVARTVDEPEE